METVGIYVRVPKDVARRLHKLAGKEHGAFTKLVTETLSRRVARPVRK